MPKNIYSIKENYKKVEEIREMETKIPTYEEFANKKFQLSPVARNKVIKKYGSNYQSSLTDKDISKIKGYGPCNWSNPRCSCQLDEKWEKLKLPCMVEGCNNKKFVGWFHSKNSYFMAVDRQCDSCGILEISNKSRIQCRGCGDVADMDDWKIACSNYHGRDSDIRFIDASVAFLVGIDGVKARLGFDLVNVKAGPVQTRLGLNADTGISTNNDSLEVKAAGFGFSVGRQTGVSTPFGEVKVDADDCIIQ